MIYDKIRDPYVIVCLVCVLRMGDLECKITFPIIFFNGFYSFNSSCNQDSRYPFLFRPIPLTLFPGPRSSLFPTS